MNAFIDYRKKENRRLGFDEFYKFHCLTNDFSPDISVETWIANDLGFDFEKRCVMALFHGATYAGPCESMFADRFPVITSDIQPVIEFFLQHKKRLLFSPDCKYRKIVFDRFLASVAKSIKPYGTLGKFIQSCFTSQYEKVNYLKLKSKCQSEWFHWGRMGHWCFSEALSYFVEAPIEPPDMEFNEGKSHRSGWAFSIGRDDLAGDSVSVGDTLFLEQTAKEYIQTLSFKTNVGFFSLETACCNYKRQHMGSRYGGCYIDEQYDETMKMMGDWSEYGWLWDKYLEGRQVVFPSSLLFENSDFVGTKKPYDPSWNKSLKNYGRIPRVEAWSNKRPQRWGQYE
tara:strand:+ start:263 stop:1285 length:1023 start_codon:yes stop_codon:yes gene_type:complete